MNLNILTKTTKNSFSQFSCFEKFLLIIYKLFSIRTKLTDEKNFLDSHFLKGINVLRENEFFILQNNNLNIYLRKFSSDYKVYVEIFLHECYVLSKDYLKSIETPVILDIGSNAGISCLYFSTINQNCTYICVEPNKKNNKVLRHNIGGNGLNYKVINKGLWHEDKKLYFHETEEFWTGKVDSTKSESIVDCLSLQSFITIYAKQDIDLLKIDVEGSEIDILIKDKLISNSLKNVHSIIIEVHDAKKISFVSTFLENNDFTTLTSSDIIFGVKR